MIVMCNGCGRVRVKGWGLTDARGLGNAWARPVNPDPSQPNAIAHELCPECANKPGRDVIVARLGRFSRVNHKTEGGA